jgi:hypothetical protein
VQGIRAGAHATEAPLTPSEQVVVRNNPPRYIHCCYNVTRDQAPHACIHANGQGQAGSTATAGAGQNSIFTTPSCSSTGVSNFSSAIMLAPPQQAAAASKWTMETQASHSQIEQATDREGPCATTVCACPVLSASRAGRQEETTTTRARHALGRSKREEATTPARARAPRHRSAADGRRRGEPERERHGIWDGGVVAPGRAAEGGVVRVRPEVRRRMPLWPHSVACGLAACAAVSSAHWLAPFFVCSALGLFFVCVFPKYEFCLLNY